MTQVQVIRKVLQHVTLYFGPVVGTNTYYLVVLYKVLQFVNTGH